jgi:hypothetical protein
MTGLSMLSNTSRMLGSSFQKQHATSLKTPRCRMVSACW